MSKEKLLDLKGRIDDAKVEKAKLEGKQESLMEELKTKWKCKTVKEAETKLRKLDDEITDLDKEIKKGIEDLKEKYELEEL